MRIRVQVEAELVVVGRDDRVVVEVFVEVRRTVAVQIVQARDLVAAEDVDFFIHDLQAQRLEKARGEAPPRQLGELVIQAAHHPHVAVEGADRRAAVGEKVEAAEEGLGVPFVRQAVGDDVHRVRAVVRADGALGDDLIGEERRAAFGERGEIGRGAELFHGLLEFVRIRCGTAPDGDLESVGGLRRELDDHAAVGLFEGGTVSAADERDAESLVLQFGGLDDKHGGAAGGLAGAGGRVAEHEGLRAEVFGFKGARENLHAVEVFEPGHFQHFRRAHGVAEDHIVAVHMEAAVMRLCFGQRALLLFSRVGEIAIRCPARTDGRLERDLTFRHRRRRPRDLRLRVAELEVVARPRQRGAQRVGVVAHVGALVRADGDDEALVGGDRLAAAAHDGAGEERPTDDAIGGISRTGGGQGGRRGRGGGGTGSERAEREQWEQ